jgi:myo-inositol-1(or 4)-monophosphatase
VTLAPGESRPYIWVFPLLSGGRSAPHCRAGFATQSRTANRKAALLNSIRTPATLLPAVLAAAQRAGETAMAAYRPGQRTSAAVESKEGGSPVTEADKAVDRYLRSVLGDLVPQAGWLSEESPDTPERLDRRQVFIVDPIDGTRAFMAGDPRWAVSIALVIDGSPALGVLHLPALGRTYAAIAGQGATLDGLPARVSQGALAGGRIAGPAPLIDRLTRGGLAVAPQPRIPSLAYRLALVASGDLEAGLASTNSHDWDIAAADLIVHEAGGRLTDLEGRRPHYNQPSPRHGVLAAAPSHAHAELTSRMRAS